MSLYKEALDDDIGNIQCEKHNMADIYIVVNKHNKAMTYGSKHKIM